MKSIIFTLFFTYSLGVSATFQKIWKGYQVSYFNQSQHLDIKINDANYKFESNKFNWQLEIKPEYDNTYLDALFSFQSRNTTKSILSYGLVKPTYKWGTLSIKQIQTHYDLSKWDSTTDDQLYGVENIINYSYDFWDRSSDKDFEMIQTKNKKGIAQSQLNIDQGYFDFFNIYLQAKLQVFSVELNKDFVQRAQKRVKLVERRVKDGLSRKVELHQAKSSLIGQQETLEKARSSLKQNLAILENIINNKIDEKFFKTISWDRHEFHYWEKHINIDTHYSLDVLKESLKTTEKALEKIAHQSGYKLLLNATYVANDFDPSPSKSMSQSYRGLRYSKNISLSFVIPLGGDKNAGLRNKYAFQKKKNELDLLTKRDELKTKKEALIDQISYLEKATRLSAQQVSLAKKILLEQNRLYLRGQASFDAVIRSEESYINAELSEKQLLAEYETLIANYAFFNNSIKSVLDIYQD